MCISIVYWNKSVPKFFWGGLDSFLKLLQCLVSKSAPTHSHLCGTHNGTDHTLIQPHSLFATQTHLQSSRRGMAIIWGHIGHHKISEDKKYKEKPSLQFWTAELPLTDTLPILLQAGHFQKISLYWRIQQISRRKILKKKQAAILPRLCSASSWTYVGGVRSIWPFQNLTNLYKISHLVGVLGNYTFLFAKAFTPIPTP